MSGQLKEVRNRIGAVMSTQQITKAMKLVAASKLRKAQQRITQMRPYANKLYDILGNIVAATEGDINIDYAKVRLVEKVLLVVVTSDRGLCGGFNSNVAKLAKQTAKEKYPAQYKAGNITLMFVGAKGLATLGKEAFFSYNKDYADLFSRLTFDNSLQAAEYLMSAYENKQFDAIEVIYNRFKNQITQIPSVEQFLPIQKLNTQPEKEKSEESSKMRPDFIFEPDRVKIMDELVPKILKTQFFRYLLDSNASEHGARMTAMDNATENAEELLRDLRITYNRARQAAITTEITEIVSGAAALENS